MLLRWQRSARRNEQLACEASIGQPEGGRCHSRSFRWPICSMWPVASAPKPLDLAKALQGQRWSHPSTSCQAFAPTGCSRQRGGDKEPQRALSRRRGARVATLRRDVCATGFVLMQVRFERQRSFPGNVLQALPRHRDMPPCLHAAVRWRANSSSRAS